MTRRNLLLILDEDDSPYSTNLPSTVDLPRLRPLSPDESPAHPQHPFDKYYYYSSIPLTVIVLLTLLLFIAFFSIYLRCFSSSADPSPSPTRRSSPPAVVKTDELPVVGYREGDHPDGQSDCAVCLCEFQEGEKVKVIPRCRHVFHPDCLDAWLSSHLSCPVCRTVHL